MTEAVIITTITVVGSVIVAYLESIRRSSHKAHQKAEAAETHAYAIHESINNRPTSASDRWDAIARDVKGIRTDISTLFEADISQRKALEEARHASDSAMSLANKAIDAVKEISLKREEP